MLDTGLLNECLFGQVAEDLRNQGYSIRENAISPQMVKALQDLQNSFTDDEFKHAGIGRGQSFVKNTRVRTDEIRWIDDQSQTGKDWLTWAAAFKTYLNRSLILGLFSFESHFARFNAGDFYKTHLDAFKGSANRVLSLVVYLNDDWSETDGGELVLYMDEHDKQGIRVLPRAGTLVCFLSEDFPHEVLPANKTRLSIAGWFRQNMSTEYKADPPR